MTETANAEQLVAEMRAVQTADPTGAPRAIEALLAERLARYPGVEGRQILLNLLDLLSPRAQAPHSASDTQVLTRVCALLLGRNVSPDELTSAQMLERLAQSLNTIFDALNQLIGVINITFSGGSTGEQTIRQFIGFQLQGENPDQSLEAYLGRINQAFLATREAFKTAARIKVAQILSTLSPETIAAERSGGLKIGPLRKAEDYDILREKIDRIQRWFDSDRFMEDLLREFEKQCQEYTRK
ncbi:MAG: hypothetical protein KFF50_05985 [Desulfatitalea sp.]|nr:hypothetical protein [Desulfatitalea sp.]